MNFKDQGLGTQGYKMRYLGFGIVMMLNLVISDISMAIDVAVEFSATAVQVAPGKPENQRIMYIGKDNVRTDSEFGNKTLIEIVNTMDQARYFLVPEEKIYLKQEGQVTGKQLLKGETGPTKPCAGMKDTDCEMLGKEMINYREAEKWEFAVRQGDKMHLSLHWIDTEHRMLVREFMPDGSLMELVPMGAEIINGRNTEKWSWRSMNPDGQVATATQWYDPELKMAIREELPGGYIRELRDIKTGLQKKALFEIPDDYKQVENLQGFAIPQPSIISAEQQ